jgi:hypothetical protein
MVHKADGRTKAAWHTANQTKVKITPTIHPAIKEATHKGNGTMMAISPKWKKTNKERKPKAKAVARKAKVSASQTDVVDSSRGDTSSRQQNSQ